ncbi:DNA translocase FtsK [Paenibacillus sediminis]|uniref:S-DNA-T family DNA segregation ATPase FtsK/SpoIIIE n=1 Tax=Paenibacillus sediminis TaxID=664909 RepID=A0ABS4H1F1_9BACL|nr:S-DNA-T family DNA segregation ATPase FtsK/SpoIIIE [Paenibacillus sediminis]
MARRRKRKNVSLSNVLKYEIYGIIFITLSVIALSGEAAVGRSLSKMFGLVLGKFYFVIPLVGIYVGLMVMIHRKWPRGWTSRKAGIVLLVLALTLMSTISTIEQKLSPLMNVDAGMILKQVHNDLQGSLISPKAENDTSMLHKDIGGGYVGAVQLAMLYWLFGMIGSRLVMIVMFFISFMLITNLSYVELMRIVRARLMKLIAVFRSSRKSKNRTADKHGPNKLVSKRMEVELLPMDDEDEDEHYSSPQNQKKTPVFFQLFSSKQPKAHHESDEDVLLDDIVMRSAYQAAPIDDEENEEVHREPNNINHDQQVDHHEEDISEDSIRGNNGPIIRDFFEQVKTEGRHEDPDYDDLMDDYIVEGTIDKYSAPRPTPLAPVESLSEMASNDLNLNGDSNLSTQDQSKEMDMITPLPKPSPKPYKLPPFRLLSKPPSSSKAGDQADYMQTARKLEATLESFGVRAKVLEVVRGPAVTRYEIQPDIGVKVSRIVNLTDDIALALAAKDIRMEAPIPGKSAIGIEVPNPEVSLVTMREVMETQVFQDSSSKLSIALGRDISGQTIVGNLAKMPHLLVAGATGSGKSVCINGIITSILYKAKPDEVKFMMVDPKMVELNVYNGIPHLLTPVVTDPKRASLALKKIVVEMEKRYELFSKSGTRNIEGYNNLMKDNPEAILPYIVVIVDELADLMMVAAHDVEEAITRLAQMARAAGIHLIIATQRPSVDVITGVIKANIPSRIAFGVSSQVDSRTILDMAGAEKLLGRGDMLFMPMGTSKPIRVQGAFMTDQEVESIVNFVREQGEAEYNEDLVPEIEETAQEQEEVLDELYDQAVQIVLEAKQASVSLLQRRMRIGYTRAARLIDSMEAHGIIGPYEGSKPREVLMSLEQYQHGRVSS